MVNELVVFEDMAQIAEIFSEEATKRLMEKYPFLQINHPYENAPIDAEDPEKDYNKHLENAPHHFDGPGCHMIYYPRVNDLPTQATLTALWKLAVRPSLPEQAQMVIFMLDFCKLQGWRALSILEGTAFMKSMAWIYASGVLGWDVVGFDPTEEDQRRKNNVTDLLSNQQGILLEQAAVMRRGMGAGASGGPREQDSDDES